MRLSTIFAAILAVQTSGKALGQSTGDQRLYARLLQEDVVAAKTAIERRGVAFDRVDAEVTAKPALNSAGAGFSFRKVVNFVDRPHTIAAVRWHPLDIIPEFYLAPLGRHGTVIVGARVVESSLGDSSCEVTVYTNTLPDFFIFNKTYSCEAFQATGRDRIKHVLEAAISSVLPH